MNSRTSFALLAVLTAVGTLTISSAYAQACVGCYEPDAGRKAADQLLLMDMPVSVWTDKTAYEHGDKIMVYGKVANVSGNPVTLTVVNSLNSVVTIAQMSVENDGSFETILNTDGELWKHDGTYTIKVNYGSASKSNKVLVELSGATSGSSNNCASSEIYLKGNYCVPYTITGGMVTGASINSNDNSIIVRINASEDGTLTLNPDKSILDGIFMVLVDGEEWDDVEYDGNNVTVNFLAGAQKIEVIGTFVIPEFGTIAVMILAVAIISIIAVSAKSKLSIMPRY
ncbi:MAG: PEFG-CTERM sorting domain-containing protein [Nitrosarchaeum sp.]|jgi:predicted secreted protein with PEFG-CTERM motif|uniref:PEFG-CTERM sorting domain-containing protein n=1 Tax=Nitrosarchaeum sp. TaxID=2026886 RepID=UPI002DE29289|nr:PEFG-CTERM sorting domain-containing protein [Nitrosarchaeum sp.]